MQRNCDHRLPQKVKPVTNKRQVKHIPSSPKRPIPFHSLDETVNSEGMKYENAERQEVFRGITYISVTLRTNTFITDYSSTFPRRHVVDPNDKSKP